MITPQQAAELVDYHIEWGGFDLSDHEIYLILDDIADMRYEYAAQVRRGTASPWLYVLSNGHFSKRGSTSVWCKRRVGCENAIRSALKRKDVGADTVEFRIVRRLVGEPEVVE